MEFETRAIHAGQEPEPLTGSVNVPIYQTSTYVQDGVGGHRGGHDYARSINPTRTALEECLASLEEAPSTASPSPRGCRRSRPSSSCSGRASRDGGQRRVRRHLPAVLEGARATGYRFSLRRPHHPGRPRAHRDRAPGHGLDRDADEPAAEGARHRARSPTPPTPSAALLVVDNTFASPYLQQPLELGADIVVHSTTKYIGGHSDVVGGFVGTSDRAMGERLRFLQNALGGVPAPLDCFLTLRGLKTLAVRMERHCDNAERIAALLAASSAVSQVFYPGLEGDAGHARGPAADAPLRGHGQVPRARRARRGRRRR